MHIYCWFCLLELFWRKQRIGGFAFKMVLEDSSGSPERRLKRQPLKSGEDGSSDHVPVKYKRPKVFCIREFPEECGPNKAVVNYVHVLEVDSVEPVEDGVEFRSPQVLKDFEQSELVGLSNGLGSEMVETMIVSSDDDEEESIELVAKVEPGGIELLKPLDHVGFVDPLEILEQETTNLSKNALVETLPKFYRPQRIISATRDFPPGVSHENSLKVIPHEGLGRDKTIVGQKLFEEAAKNDVKQCKEEVQDGDEYTSKLIGMFSEETPDKVEDQSEGDGNQFGTSCEIESRWEDAMGKSLRPHGDSNLSQPDCKSQQVIKEYKRDVAGLEGDMGMEFVNNMEEVSLRRKVSCVSGNMNQLQGEKPTGSQVGREIVLALMAVPNCPLKQTKRPSNLIQLEL